MPNKMQRYTVYFIRKLLYMFWVVPPPVIRSANNCIYSIWYLSYRYCYLPLAAGCILSNIYWNILMMHEPMKVRYVLCLLCGTKQIFKYHLD